MKRKEVVAVLFGGPSQEHEVSLQSAANVVAGFEGCPYSLFLIGIHKDSSWHLYQDQDFLIHPGDPSSIRLKTPPPHSSVFFHPSPGERPLLVRCSDARPVGRVDVVFPVLHGSYGEDGTVQALCELLGVPCVGAGVLASAVCMDKAVTKKLLVHEGIPIVPFARWEPGDAPLCFTALSEQWKVKTLFVKPTSAGSSLGVSRVVSQSKLDEALTLALSYGRASIIEPAVVGREVECAVLGNRAPEVSSPGEIVLRGASYTYQAKYLSSSHASVVAPVELPKTISQQVRDLSRAAFLATACEGMARVDFFLSRDNRLVVNEINTIPGFTDISMYPKLWESAGLPLPSLLERLVALAKESFRSRIQNSSPRSRDCNGDEETPVA